MNLAALLQAVKDGGHRLTKARRLILAILWSSRRPLSASEILSRLDRRKIRVDKTTVYREIAFLKGLDMVREIQFGEGQQRYELTPEDHHHHIVCVRCRRVDDIVLEKDLDGAEEKIARLKSFRVISHSLEFFGLCSRCQ
jgi:Fur family transcriptional regulator, ferric uptake regulator